ncbi:2Fe-2S iron-sulfur cluster-binding protein [Streptomyces sp. NPDC047000]|uniref:2Fe-2S iron-sulfur cluster-binding protein n=1 Tax=Streptomyces sp. NPDC047000 TaxID=3155474 RepID=UPI0033FC1EC5
MTDDQHGEGTPPRSAGRWDPLPQGDYDDGATAFVKLPEGGIDALLAANSPLAAPGHGYVPPRIAATPPEDGAGPAVGDAWSVPPGGAEWPDPNAVPQGTPDDRFTYNPATTQQWDFGDTGGTETGQTPVPGTGPHVPGQWSIPVAGGDLPDESGEFTASSLVEQWGGTPPATLPGGAAAPWAPQQPAAPGWDRPTPGDGPSAHDAAATAYTRDPAHPNGTDGRGYPAAPSGTDGRGFRPDGQHGGGQHGDGQHSDGRGHPVAGDGTDGRGYRADGHVTDGRGYPVAGDPGTDGRGYPAVDDRTDGHGYPAVDDRTDGHGYPAPADGTDGHGYPAPADGTDGRGYPAAHAPAPAPSDAPVREFDAPRAAEAPAPEAHASPAEHAAPAEPARGPAAPGSEPGAPEPADGAQQAAEAADGPGGHTAGETAASGTDGLPGSPDPAGTDRAGTAPEDREPSALPQDEHPLASFTLSVNGVDRPVSDAWIGESLLYVLRERLGLAGAKDGCSEGECGACNVQVDGRLVASCLVPAVTAAGSEVRTVEGLAVDGQPSDVQRALAECGAVQCGFCVPGMAMTVHDLLEGNPAPTELEARQALSGNLCRCSGYRGVLDAVRTVVAEREAHATAEAAETDGTEARIPHQAGPGAGGVHHSVFDTPGFDTPGHTAQQQSQDQDQDPVDQQPQADRAQQYDERQPYDQGQPYEQPYDEQHGQHDQYDQSYETQYDTQYDQRQYDQSYEQPYDRSHGQDGGPA